MDRIPLSISLAPAGGIRGRKIYISSKKAISLGLTNSGLWDAGPSTLIMQAISNLISESNRKKKTYPEIGIYSAMNYRMPFVQNDRPSICFTARIVTRHSWFTQPRELQCAA